MSLVLILFDSACDIQILQFPLKLEVNPRYSSEKTAPIITFITAINIIRKLFNLSEANVTDESQTMII
jgi:hypothetical protein